MQSTDSQRLPTTFFTELEQKISQFIWKHKRSQIAKPVLIKKNGAEEINLPDFRLYYKVTSNQQGMVWAQNQKYKPMELQGQKAQR